RVSGVRNEKKMVSGVRCQKRLERIQVFRNLGIEELTELAKLILNFYPMKCEAYFTGTQSPNRLS
ncbi:MAG: hypothetical protein PVF79_24460, partial [Desulfobacterales bacterium]